MKFVETALQGCTLIEIDRIGDNRGFFARTFCSEEFSARGLNPVAAQCSISFSAKRGTTRGLHFQRGSAREDKLVRCIKGAIFDVMVDLREGSPNFGKWLGQVLTAENNLQLHSCQGFAHGFQTLTEDCIVSYHISQPYNSELSGGSLERP
ncbi:dTDP-4-dehydrorhamnose 3,5-epimerase family protein [Aliirhizobium terrae]|nr:dTDP-4-dehydrorhamnose 3,5-epimerase family protein [Rhizobium sp. CC-CFT758]WJH39051.1 dTDP-4-dehydrorhamnose 3,5-epimerase family protein [Rhizobium sp. CC-CFT758]